MTSLGSGIWFPRMFSKVAHVAQLLNQFIHSASMNQDFTTRPTLMKKLHLTSHMVPAFCRFTFFKGETNEMQGWKNGFREYTCYEGHRLRRRGFLRRSGEVKKWFSEEGSFELRPESWKEAMISWSCGLRRPSPLKISFSSILRRAKCLNS